MFFIPKARQISWTHHAEAKMAFYRLSKQRVMRVIHSPKRVEEGVAPKTIAMMQPPSVKLNKTKAQEIWSQEIWVMVQDLGRQRKIISAWRYPGVTKPRSADFLDLMRKEYREFLGKTK